MKVIKQSVILDEPVDGMALLRKIERAARTCYKSEGRINLEDDESCKRFIRSVVSRGHESVLEHATVTLRYITDRGVTHELVRHRVASYSQESTRYCNYGKSDIEFVEPVDIYEQDNDTHFLWMSAMKETERIYQLMISHGTKPELARSVLPNSLKTEIVMTMNIRELRHFLKLRTDKAAHPQMKDLAIKTLRLLQETIPVVFDDIEVNNG